MAVQAPDLDDPLLRFDAPGDLPARATQTLRSAIRVRAGLRTQGLECVADEVPVAMVFNGISHAVMLASPADLEDFGLGFSLAEGVIERSAELYETDVHDHASGIEIRMRISGRAFEALKARRRSLTGRTGCGLCGVDSLQQVARPVAAVSRGPAIGEQAIERAFAQLSQSQALHALTGAMHAAAWADTQGNLVAVREDLGRHNALDKLIGALAHAGRNPSQGFAIVTSRASYEMVLKVASYGGGLLAAISAPTGLAVDLAAQAGMTLCGFVRNGQMVIYHDARSGGD